MNRVDASDLRAEEKLPPLTRMLLECLVPPLMLGLAVWWASTVSFLLAHTVAELFSVVVAFTALVVATTSRHFTRNHFHVFIGITMGWCAGLDLLHALTFKGMGLVGVDAANPSVQLWIAARLLQSGALVVSPWFLVRRVSLSLLHLVFGAMVLAIILAISSGHFPDAYVEGQGLTHFKVAAEYAVMAGLCLFIVVLWRQQTLTTPRLRWSISVAAVIMMASEFAFTQYGAVDEPVNLLGHVLKICAYWFIFMALVKTTLTEPFSMLTRAASTFDAVPDPTYVVGKDLRILQANQAAARVNGTSAAQLVGQSAHDMLHDQRLSVDQCPVCQAVVQGNGVYFGVLDLGEDRFVECHVAPFNPFPGQQAAWVMVVRDVSRRERLAHDREYLVQQLQGRVKEVLCLYEVAQLCKASDISMDVLLNRVIQVMSVGFTDPERLRVGISSPWGPFGQPVPAGLATLQSHIRCHGDDHATMTVWYHPDPRQASPALSSQEAGLLDAIALQLSDACARLHAQDRVKRLSYLFEMLSATNRAIAHSNTPADMLKALRAVLVSQGAFEKLFIAVAQCQPGQQSQPLSLDFQHGMADDRLTAMLEHLNAPDSLLGHARLSTHPGQVLVRSLPTSSHESDAQALQAWERYLQWEGIRQWALVPIVVQGQLRAVVALCAGSSLDMDHEQLHLLETMSADISLALEHFDAVQQRQLAESQSQDMERRFAEIFQHSPVPMQIVSLQEGRLKAINQAHERWLGYAPGDIADAQQWFEQAYPDVNTRTALMADWQTSLERALKGESVESPELTLRGKDGRMHVARGTVAVVNDDVLVAWTDLSAIRNSEQALRDSEQRFRSMVEQSVSGMYVRRDGRFLYVNPSYCEILGWSAQELLGHSVLDFTDPSPQNMAQIRQAWDELEMNEQATVSYTVPVRRKDGQMVELGLHARRIVWDDGMPATIVLAQDITQRKRNEEKIADYVRQLEASMNGTLQAVANMVEMRDPYTAGHERRVGLIAAALAREMGWDDTRSRSLEQLGLVHDIGKIAVPAEILTKPTRLSPVEYELIKGHVDAGYEILKHIPFPTPVADIIRQHHERMDGSGYPLGLKGDQILPEARILAVADVIESMASHRPYRPALGVDVALAEVERGRGRLYDPEVCDAAMRLIKDKGYVLPG